MDFNPSRSYVAGNSCSGNVQDAVPPRPPRSAQLVGGDDPLTTRMSLLRKQRVVNRVQIRVPPLALVAYLPRVPHAQPDTPWRARPRLTSSSPSIVPAVYRS